MMHMIFAAIVIAAVLLAALIGIYAVYTWREVEMEKLKVMAMRGAKRHEQVSQQENDD
jgi:uncharacterized membrane protein (DUF106 family)